MRLIKQNTYIAVLFLVLFIIVAFTGVTIWIIQKHTNDVYAIKQQETARIEAKLLVFQAYVKKTLEKYDYITQDLASRQYSGSIDKELKRLKSLDPKVMDMLYIDESGYIKYWTKTGSPPKVNDRAYYSKLKHNSLKTRYISSAQVFEAHSESLFFSISRPMINTLNEFSGVFAVLVAIESLNGDLEKQLSIGNAHFAIFKKNGAPLMRLPSINNNLGLSIDTPPSDKADDGHIIHMNRKSQFSGISRRVAWVYLPNYELWAVITEPQKNIETIVDKTFNNNLILFFFVLAFLIILFGALFVFIFKSRNKFRVLYNSELKLKNQAERDPLTNLYNRRYFDDYTKNVISNREYYDNQICIVIVDIDDFKSVNDKHGHSIGDQVLLSVANCLVNFKRSDDCVVRYGGEEFVILLPNSTRKQSCQYAELIRTRIEKLHTISDSDCSIPVTVSIGVSSINTGENSIDLAFQRADSALYKAKNSGKNCFQFN